MAGAVVVRRGEPTDLPGLRRILFDVSHEPDDDRHVPIEPDEVDALAAGLVPLLDRVPELPGAIFVAEVAAQLAGWVTMRGSDRKRLCHQCVLGISVDRSQRGRGVGRALMTAAIAWARGQRLDRIELRVMPRHAKAIALYERMGFIKEGTVRGGIRIGDALHDDFIMGLLLR
jgi:RimJ/RimL family protein N-acetyltransferase